MKKKVNSFILKFACVGLVLLLCMACLISCNKDNPDTPPNEPNTENSAEALNLVSNGKVNVRVVYQSKGGKAVVAATQQLCKTLTERGGAKISFVSDMVAEPTEEVVEILKKVRE